MTGDSTEEACWDLASSNAVVVCKMDGEVLGNVEVSVAEVVLKYVPRKVGPVDIQVEAFDNNFRILPVNCIE